SGGPAARDSLHRHRLADQPAAQRLECAGSTVHGRDEDGVRHRLDAADHVRVPPAAAAFRQGNARRRDQGVIAMRLAIGDYALLWVLKASDDLGFSTKISFVAAESDDPRDYDCFAPGVWYRRNEFAPDTAIGKDPGCEYFWRMET